MKNKKSVNTALDKPQKTNNGLKYCPESHTVHGSKSLCYLVGTSLNVPQVLW